MHIPHDIEAVVLANGDYPFADVPFQLLKRVPYVVCCDGGANEYIERGCLPDIIIGDGDSLSETNRLKYADLIFHNPDQETNDQTKAVQYLLSKGKRKIAIVGATGKREDHTIGNVSLLMEYMRMGAEVRSYTDYGVFVYWNLAKKKNVDGEISDLDERIAVRKKDMKK